LPELRAAEAEVAREWHWLHINKGGDIVAKLVGNVGPADTLVCGSASKY